MEAENVGDEGVVVTWEVVPPGVASLYGWTNLDLSAVVRRMNIRLITCGGGQCEWEPWPGVASQNGRATLEGIGSHLNVA